MYSNHHFFSLFNSSSSSSVKSAASALKKYSLADNRFLFLFLFHQAIPANKYCNKTY